MAPTKLPPATNIVNVQGVSDGDANHRPSGNSFSRSDAEVYMRKIATKWVEEEGKGLKPGRVYTLDKLPAGYALFERQRQSKPTHIDKYLFGHPSHTFFNSPNQFYPHFKYIMNHQKGDLCPCDVCSTKKKPGGHKGSAAKTGGIRGRAPLTAKPKDEEGSPLTFSFLLELLQRERKLERLIQEKQNMDWRAERVLVPTILGEITKQPSYVPRVGELVLWCRNIHGEIRQNHTGEYMFFDAESKIFSGYPAWMCGVVTQAPISSQPVKLDDILRETKKDYAVNSSGFRIECYPDPNSRNKDLSKQYSYVPLHHIRPMVFWKEILPGSSRKDWHPTIKNCLTAMATFSSIERYRFRGTWPNANVYSKGCFLGAESIFVGDTIRLMPGGTGQVTDVLRITDVVLKFKDIQPKDNRGGTGEDASNINILFHGYGYTLDVRRSKSRLPADREKSDYGISLPMQGYGQWYHMSRPGDLLSVSFSSVLGRLLELEAVQKWIPLDRQNELDIGRPGIVQSREYARQNDTRLQNQKPIFLSDSRIESLDLLSFNGLEVGPANGERDPHMWRNVLAVIDGVQDRVATKASAPDSSIDEDDDDEGDEEVEKFDQAPTLSSFSPINTMKKSSSSNNNNKIAAKTANTTTTTTANKTISHVAINISSSSSSSSEEEEEDVEGVINDLIRGEGLLENDDDDDDDDDEDELASPERKRVRLGV